MVLAVSVRVIVNGELNELETTAPNSQPHYKSRLRVARNELDKPPPVFRSRFEAIDLKVG